ncbi:hypothetical protein [Streptomyces mirabilis]|uniref:hypothetical protein n=1 Tax=Streptomyces mirabilis TaxID=68239 RepID=UPI0033A49B82
MSDNPQVKAILEHIETRERELADQAGQFRARIEELTQPYGERAGTGRSRCILRVHFHEVRDPALLDQLLTLPLPSPSTGPDRPDIPDHPAYQQILTALTDAGRPIRARDLCQTLDLPILPKNTEGIRCKLKRLVSRGILIEPEPGLFARPGA